MWPRGVAPRGSPNLPRWSASCNVAEPTDLTASERNWRSSFLHSRESESHRPREAERRDEAEQSEQDRIHRKRQSEFEIPPRASGDFPIGARRERDDARERAPCTHRDVLRT